MLPAFLTLFGIRANKRQLPSFGETLSKFPYKHAKAVVISAIVLGMASIPLLTRVYFDYNPLDLYGKMSESVRTIRELFKSTESQPWTISILTQDGKSARMLAEKLSKLREVKTVLTVSDFVPEHQPEKLQIISDIALFMPLDMGSLSIKYLNYEQELKALNAFEKNLKTSLLSPPMSDNPSAKRLYDCIHRFKNLLGDPAKGEKAFAVLEKGLLSNLPGLFRRLETSLQARPFNESDLPRQLVDQYVSADGRQRVQVFPSENILDVDALKRFVRAVLAVAPDATDAPVTIYESGRAVITSFKQATIYSIVAITIFLLIGLRSLSTTLLTLIPLMLGILLTGAASVLLDIPLNFANVIVVPLLLGIGVHSGIIFIYRYLNEPPENGNMLKTSTARAVFFSILTTIISTGSLSFSPHRGIASMGMLLTICLSFLIICTLILLPALLEFSRRRYKNKTDESFSCKEIPRNQ